jgi:hypothetical protein
MAVSPVRSEVGGVSLAIGATQSVGVQGIEQKDVAFFLVHERVERKDEHGKPPTFSVYVESISIRITRINS